MICSVEGCGKPVNARGWCAMHLSRWQRHGSLDEPAKRPRRVCGVEGCDRTRAKYGFCGMHAARFRRNGDPLGGRYDTGSYDGTHVRIRAERGRAAEYACVDCGGPALDWSYVHDCPDEQVATLSRGSVVPFCVHVHDCYVPRCRKCHRAYDANPTPVRVLVRA